MTRKLEDLVTVLLLPAFFAFTGMHTEIGLVSGLENWLICGAIILVATLGKFGGTCVAAAVEDKSSASITLIIDEMWQVVSSVCSLSL